jgi:hypothetical protein
MSKTLDHQYALQKRTLFILSNNHVLAANNSGYIGDPIIQPATYNAGIVGKDTIASLHRWVPINTETFNYVDVAVAEVLGGLKWSKYVKPYVSIIGKPNDFIDAKIDMEVEKTGRTTGYTQGQITSINETIKVNYSQMGIVKFKNQIRTTSMSKGGDSGSCLFKKGTKEPVALLFAGSNSASFYNPMKMILSSLSMSWTNKYPSGNDHSFPSVPSFDIKKDTKLKTVVPSFQSPKGSGQLLANFGILATPKQFRTKGASIMYKSFTFDTSYSSLKAIGFCRKNYFFRVAMRTPSKLPDY